MKYLLLCLGLLFSSSAFAYNVSWTPSETREDGTILLPEETKGFRIYWGETPGDYQHQITINSRSATSRNIVVPAAITIYVVVTQIDTANRESLYSDELVMPGI